MYTNAKVFFNTNDVCQMLGINRHTLAAAVKRGTVPQPIQLSRRTFRWKTADLDNWAKGASPAGNKAN